MWDAHCNYPYITIKAYRPSLLHSDIINNVLSLRIIWASKTEQLWQKRASYYWIRLYSRSQKFLPSRTLAKRSWWARFEFINRFLCEGYSFLSCCYLRAWVSVKIFDSYIIKRCARALCLAQSRVGKSVGDRIRWRIAGERQQSRD